MRIGKRREGSEYACIISYGMLLFKQRAHSTRHESAFINPLPCWPLETSISSSYCCYSHTFTHLMNISLPTFTSLNTLEDDVYYQDETPNQIENHSTYKMLGKSTSLEIFLHNTHLLAC